MNNQATITLDEYNFFQRNGYLVKKQFIQSHKVEKLQNKVIEHLEKRIMPFELEQEVHYPGSPKTKNEIGGDTIRRLLFAHMRDDLFKKWQLNKNATAIIKGLFHSKELFLVQSHHNCIMTKQPRYSSVTNWHKDTRYWNFDNQQLINTWLPLGNETLENGCLLVIPGSHLWDTPQECLDERLFLRKDLIENLPWLDKAIPVELHKGDLLIFHANLFHAAGRNNTETSKNAIVSTYHCEKNHEIKSPYPELETIFI